MCMLQYHCAARKKHKGSRISAKAARYKRCRVKKGGKPCKYSYVVEVSGEGIHSRQDNRARELSAEV